MRIHIQRIQLKPWVEDDGSEENNITQRSYYTRGSIGRYVWTLRFIGCSSLLGLIIGVVDCVTFLWMREEIKEKFRRFRVAEGVTFQSWLEEMRQGKPEVVATGIVGHGVLNRALYVAKKLGYEAVDVSELKSRLATKYTVTFKREERRKFL